MLQNKKFARLAAQAADKKKGENIVALDVRKLTTVADYFILVTVHSLPQAQAVRDAVEEELEKYGLELKNRQQQLSKRWVLLDFGSIILHVFIKEAREFFNLERLWSKAVPVDWEKEK